MAGDSRVSAMSGLYVTPSKRTTERGINLLSQLDKAERITQSGSYPMREIVRVNRDAMTAHSRTRPKCLKSKRFGSCRLDHVPEVDVEIVTKTRHLVDQGDVDVAVCVLEQLGCLCLTGALGANNGVNESRIERLGCVGAGVCVATDHFRG